MSTRGQQLLQNSGADDCLSPTASLSSTHPPNPANMSVRYLLGTKAGNSFLHIQPPLMLSLTIQGTMEWSPAHTGKEPGSKDKHENETAHRDLAPVF